MANIFNWHFLEILFPLELWWIPPENSTWNKFLRYFDKWCVSLFFCFCFFFFCAQLLQFASISPNFLPAKISALIQTYQLTKKKYKKENIVFWLIQIMIDAEQNVPSKQMMQNVELTDENDWSTALVPRHKWIHHQHIKDLWYTYYTILYFHYYYEMSMMLLIFSYLHFHFQACFLHHSVFYHLFYRWRHYQWRHHLRLLLWCQ